MSKEPMIAGSIPVGALALHVILLGKTRSGKSSKLRLMVEHCLDQGMPVGIIDPKGDWWGLKLSATGKSAGYPVVIFGGEHADVPINEHSGAAVAELVATGNRPFLIDLGGWMPAKRTRFFVDFASTFFLKTRGQRVLAIDEVHNFAPQGKVMDPEAGKALHWANRLASEGGGKGITLLSASQRPQKVHKDYVTSHETLIACKVIHKLDRDAVKDWVDGCGDPEQGKEVFKTLGSLPKPQAWVWSPEIGFGPKLVTFPMFKTYDSFKPQEVGDAAKLKGWASVDLEDVTAKLGKVIEEAKANDPKELKAQIARLTALVNAKPAPAAADPQAIERARQEGHVAGEAEAAPIWFRRGVEHMAEHIARLSQPEIIVYGLKQFARVGALPTVTGVTKAPATIPSTRAATIVAQSPRPAAAPRSTVSGPSNLSKAERKIMTALAQYPNGRTKAQVAILTGYAVGGGGFNNAISSLRTAGRLTSTGDLYRATQEGLDALGSFDPLPHGDALLQHWYRQLGKAERASLESLVAVYPDSMTKADLALAAGYEPSGGGFNNALSRLRTLELMTGRGDDLCASESLFG